MMYDDDARLRKCMKIQRGIAGQLALRILVCEAREVVTYTWLRQVF